MSFIQGVIDAFVWIYVMILRLMSTIKHWFIILLIFVGCSQSSTTNQSQSITESPCELRKIVQCDECGGTGEVVYDENHIMVTHNFSEPGKYICPMCKGFGELIKEEK